MGGKSRKTGGISKSLIDRIKAGKTSKDRKDTTKQASKKTCQAQPKENKSGLF